jgi:RNA polymerase sigma-70 factor (ECF subfamily)
VDGFIQRLAPHRVDLERYCRAALMSRDDVPDVLQEAVTRAWRDRGRFVENTCFRAFMFRYLVYEVRNHNRRLVRNSRRQSPLDSEPLDATTRLFGELTHDALLLAPAHALDACSDEVRAAFLNLAEPGRSAFLLASLGGFTGREIGELLGLPLGTVLSLVFRVRAELRRRLAEDAQERGLLPRESAP